MTHGPTLTIAICVLATIGVIARPFGLPEATWSVAGAVLLVALRILSLDDALVGAGKGLDVYLFLTGMMLLAEVARSEGLFRWLAAVATERARGSAKRLFLLVYAVGTVVTIFMSNDATAVVLTPAVAAAVKTAKVERPLPYLLICALIANAASFVLPISNPANLVIYGSKMPTLLEWIPRFLLPSAASIVLTYVALRLTQRRALAQAIASEVDRPTLEGGGVVAAVGIVVTAATLLVASALDAPLGWPAAIAGSLTTMVVSIRARRPPWSALRSVSWGVLPLVAGLFVLVEALERAGLVGALRGVLRAFESRSVAGAACGSGAAIALASNVVNNLPAGLLAGRVVQSAHAPDAITSAVLIGVDLGPNLSVTGSLATILWLSALRREGQSVGGWTFFKLGLVVMPPALVGALAAILLTHPVH